MNNNADERRNLVRNREESSTTVIQKISSIQEPLLSSESRISKDRRRFIIVIVFDVCLTALLWIISTVSKGSDWPVVFFREVNMLQPNFMKISLFDVVVAAVIRTSVLILFYAIFLTGHWLPVAITTIVTTFFLVAKALFFFSPAQGNLPQYMVFVSSFVVAWFELWLVPFHILPRERRDMIMPEYNASSVVPICDAQTDEEFRSALEYSSDSDEENLSTTLFNGKVYSKKQYIEEVEGAELKAKELLTQIDSWKLLHRFNPEIRLSKEKQTYFIRDEIACSPKSLFKAVWKDNKLWNRQVADSRTILHIDAATELVHSITIPTLRGYIAPRDFLDVRRMKLDTRNDIYEGAYVSVDSSVMPGNANPKLVRGVNGPNYIRVTRSSNNPQMAQIEWIQECDVKSSFPRRLIENSMCTFFQDYMNSLKTFISNYPSEYS